MPSKRRDDPRLGPLLARYDLVGWRAQAATTRDIVAAEINHYLKLVRKGPQGMITVCAPRAELAAIEPLLEARGMVAIATSTCGRTRG